MKTVNFKFALMALFAIALSITSCKKEPGPQGPTGPQGPQGVAGPSAKTYTYNLTFNSTTQYASYSGISADFDTDDMVLTFVYNANYGNDYYVQLPYVANGTVNIYAEVNEITGHIFVNTDKADGTSGSPWSSGVTFKFKSILIKSSQIKKNVNHAIYSEVVKAYDIKD